MSCNNTSKGLPEGFEEVKRNEYENSMFNYVSSYDKTFYLENREGKIVVYEDIIFDKKPELILKDGKLEGRTTGFCGEGFLEFTPNKNPDTTIVIKNGIISHILEYSDDYYTVTNGPTEDRLHLATLEKIERKGDKFLFHEIHKFYRPPYLYNIYNDKLIFLSSKQLTIIENGKKKELFVDEIWNNNKPNSICFIDERNVFLGMDYVIVRLDLIDEKMFFYQKRK